MLKLLAAGCLVLLVLAAPALAVPVTIEMNGFPNLSGGHVSGPGIEGQQKWEPGAQRIVVANPIPGATYSVDFYHNSGEGGSDFSFTINQAGTGVASVGPGGGRHTMIATFRPGETTLKLLTHEITYNGNLGQTGIYFIQGVTTPADARRPDRELEPLKFKAIPGTYRVDNLYNSGQGNEDFTFVVNSRGQVGPFGGSEEYAEFSGSTVNPRATIVQFRIEATRRINYHATHEAGKPQVAEAPELFIYDLEMPATVGSAGLNIWSFGSVTVMKSNSVKPDGSPLEKATADNDFLFYPWLRHDRRDGFYFVTTEGKRSAVHAEAAGMMDDGKTPLTVKVTATIARGGTTRPAATQPATGAAASGAGAPTTTAPGTP